MLGGGGALGAKVVERLLAQHRFSAVGVWTVQPLRAALRGLQPLGQADWLAFGANTALIIFDRARHANGREAAFGAPMPADLPALAAQLHALGVQALVVVVPHAPGLLPQALQLEKGGTGGALEAALRSAVPNRTKCGSSGFKGNQAMRGIVGAVGRECPAPAGVSRVCPCRQRKHGGWGRRGPPCRGQTRQPRDRAG